MAKPEWGTKRTCLNCGARFYDLQRLPIVCPKCETNFQPEDFVKSRRGKSAPVAKAAVAAPAAAAKPAAAEEEGDLEVEVESGDDEDDLVDGDDDLDDDGDDDLPAVSGNDEDS